MNKEKWKPLLPDKFGDKYYISDRGNIANSKTGKLLKPGIEDGYVLYDLTDINGKRKSYRAHRLTLEAFVSPAPDDKPVCRHLDGNSLNNNIDNLVWGTVQENHQDKHKHGTTLKGQAHGKAKLKEEDVRELLTLVKKFIDTRGIRASAIGHITDGKNWTHLYKEIILEEKE